MLKVELAVPSSSAELALSNHSAGVWNRMRRGEASQRLAARLLVAMLAFLKSQGQLHGEEQRERDELETVLRKPGSGGRSVHNVFGDESLLGVKPGAQRSGLKARAYGEMLKLLAVWSGEWSSTRADASRVTRDSTSTYQGSAGDSQAKTTRRRQRRSWRSLSNGC